MPGVLGPLRAASQADAVELEQAAVQRVGSRSQRDIGYGPASAAEFGLVLLVVMPAVIAEVVVDALELDTITLPRLPVHARGEGLLRIVKFRVNAHHAVHARGKP
jgi:hypothetical protein